MKNGLRAVSLVVLFLWLAGCAGITGQARTQKFDDMLRLYERSMRWSEYEKAFALVAPADAKMPDFEHLKGIKITTYDPLGAPQTSPDKMRVTQIVEIRYVYISRMVERRMVDRQVWEYAEKDGRWYLRSEFPKFP